MHRKADELFRNAGFSRREHSGDGDQSGSLDMNARTDQLQSLSQGGNESPVASGNPVPLESGTPQTSSGGLSGALSGAGSSLLSAGGGLLEGLLGGGLLGDLFSGISDLFGGGQSQPPPLVQYDAPQSQDFELATGGGQVGDAVYNQHGDPEVAPVTEPALGGLQYLGAPVDQSDSSASSAAGSRSGSQSSSPITVNVQAMDSQSFMDRSADIATAVRQAMLNMHSINDVISEL